MNINTSQIIIVEKNILLIFLKSYKSNTFNRYKYNIMDSGIKEPKTSPIIKIINSEHRIVVIGPSRLVDPSVFYENFNRIAEDNILKFPTFAFLDFHISYLNSSSSKWLLHILKNLQDKFKGSKLITVNWYYDEDDDSILEAGEIFHELLDLPFNFFEV